MKNRYRMTMEAIVCFDIEAGSEDEARQNAEDAVALARCNETELDGLDNPRTYFTDEPIPRVMFGNNYLYEEQQ
jgi:hypothetical protein